MPKIPRAAMAAGPPILTVLALALIFAPSCEKKTETLHILTDRKETASIVEMYGALEPRRVVTFRHVEAVDAGIIAKEEPDLIIAADLNTPEITALLRKTEIEIETYSALIGEEGSAEQECLVPLAFELPMIIGTEETMRTLPDPVTVQPMELRAAAERFGARDASNRPVRLGFSPAWNPDSFIDLLLIDDIDAFSTTPGFVDEEHIGRTMIEIREWRESIAGGPEQDAAFDAKYRYIPDVQLLLEGRISFSRSNFAEWAMLPDEIARKLDIRYWKGDRHIPVTSIVSAGIPKSSKSAGSAEAFLVWLTDADVQEAIMTRWERDGINIFGFLGGLSSIRRINESVIPGLYPAFAGKIPEGHYFSAPSAFPHRWKRIRSEVIRPWYRKAMENAPAAGTLSEAFRRWELSSVEESE